MNRRARRIVCTVTMSTRGQLTVPVALRRALGLTAGSVVEVFPLDNQRFVAQVWRPSRILEFAGDLRDLDKSPAPSDEKGQSRR